MKRPLLAAALLTTVFATHADVLAGDCFPICANETTKVEALPTPPAVVERDGCGNALAGTVESVEKLNTRLQPIKEIAGYVRSPQGLAIKLVNDHIFTIPAWVTFAIDPVGTIKQKAIGEVRAQVKEAITKDATTTACERELPTPTAPKPTVVEAPQYPLIEETVKA